MLSLLPINAGVFAVHDASGLHVGNLKRVGAVWKFKAVGYAATGQLVPGGGPLTARHNRVFEHADAAAVSAALLTD